MYLLAGTVTFISVFIQVTLRIRAFQRILKKQAGRTDRIVLILLFDGFSILGTYMGIPLTSGAIGNVRDLGPLIAGLVGGPLLGLGAGLIGGIHRYFLGGLTRISCALATIIIGLMRGFIHKLNRGKLPKLGWPILFTVRMECFHMALTLLIVRPFDEALVVVKTVTLPMMLANCIGVVMSILFMPENMKA